MANLGRDYYRNLDDALLERSHYHYEPTPGPNRRARRQEERELGDLSSRLERLVHQEDQRKRFTPKAKKRKRRRGLWKRNEFKHG